MTTEICGRYVTALSRLVGHPDFNAIQITRDMILDDNTHDASPKGTATWYPGFKDPHEAITQQAKVSFKCWVDPLEAPSSSEEATPSAYNQQPQRERSVSFGGFKCALSLDKEPITALACIQSPGASSSDQTNKCIISFGGIECTFSCDKEPVTCLDSIPTNRPPALDHGSTPFLPFPRPRAATTTTNYKDHNKKLAYPKLKEHNKNKWCVWSDYMPSEKHKNEGHMSQLDFQCRVEHTGGFSTINQFQHKFGHKFLNPKEGLAMRVFKAGVQPLWEDEANRGARSGKWIIQSECKSLMMLAAFRRILGRMVDGKLEGVNGIISKRRRGKHMVVLWSQAHDKAEDPFNIEQMVMAVARELQVKLTVSFKHHRRNKNKKASSTTSSPACSPILGSCRSPAASPILSFSLSDSDYDVSPVLSPVLGSSLIPTPVDRPPMLSLSECAATTFFYPYPRGALPMPKVSLATRPRSLSWAHRTTQVNKLLNAH